MSDGLSVKSGRSLVSGSAIPEKSGRLRSREILQVMGELGPSGRFERLGAARGQAQPLPLALHEALAQQAREHSLKAPRIPAEAALEGRDRQPLPALLKVEEQELPGEPVAHLPVD